MGTELTLSEVPGGFALHGDLRADAVTALLSQLPVGAERWEMDLAGVTNVDSAGLALLLEWSLRMQSADGELLLQRAPSQLVRLAQISSIDTLLGFSTDDLRDDKENDGA